MRSFHPFRRARAGLLAAALALLAASCQPPARMDGRVTVAWPAGPVRPVMLPLIPASHRWLVEIPFARPDGGERRALAWVNPGMPAPILSRALYRDLALDRGRDLAFRLGDVAVRVAGDTVAEGASLPGGLDLLTQLFAPRPVEAVLPAGVLQSFAVALDPAAGTLTLGPSGSLPARGVPVPVRIAPGSGLVTAEATAGSETLVLVLDPGSSYTWLRGRTARRLIRPGGEQARGAIGRSALAMADLAPEQDGTVLRLPELALGGLVVSDIGALATAPLGGAATEAVLGDIFWDMWQEPAGRTVDGWLGNNLLGDGRLTIDYPAGWARFERQRRADPHDLDGIGLTVLRNGDGYVVGRVVTRDGFPLVQDVAPGDILRGVDGRPVTGLAPEGVIAALSGRPGTRRSLALERQGVPLTVEARAISLR